MVALVSVAGAAPGQLCFCRCSVSKGTEGKSSVPPVPAHSGLINRPQQFGSYQLDSSADRTGTRDQPDAKADARESKFIGLCATRGSVDGSTHQIATAFPTHNPNLRHVRRSISRKHPMRNSSPCSRQNWTIASSSRPKPRSGTTNWTKCGFTMIAESDSTLRRGIADPSRCRSMLLTLAEGAIHLVGEGLR